MNAPVENTQCRSAPTRCPCISARIGYAIPVLNIASVGGGSSENETTCLKTVCGSLLITIEVFCSYSGGVSLTLYSSKNRPGSSRQTTEATFNVVAEKDKRFWST